MKDLHGVVPVLRVKGGDMRDVMVSRGPPCHSSTDKRRVAVNQVKFHVAQPRTDRRAHPRDPNSIRMHEHKWKRRETDDLKLITVLKSRLGGYDSDALTVIPV